MGSDSDLVDHSLELNSSCQDEPGLGNRGRSFRVIAILVYVDEALGVEAKMKQDKRTGFAKRGTGRVCFAVTWLVQLCVCAKVGDTFVSLRKLVLSMAKKKI